MSEQLWSDERIAFEIGNLTKGLPVNEVATLIESVRDEYEARIARMNDQAAQLAEVQKKRIAEMEAKLRTMSELDEQHLLLIDEQSARIAELVAKL